MYQQSIPLELVNSAHHLSLCLPETPKVSGHLEMLLSLLKTLHTTCSEWDMCVAEAPGKVQDFRVTDSTYTTLSLSWNKPNEIQGVEDEARGYFVEIRPAESTEWDRCNSNLITMTSYTVKGLKSLAMYWVRVVATNDGGEGEAQELDNYILATPPPGMRILFKFNYANTTRHKWSLFLHVFVSQLNLLYIYYNSRFFFFY